MKLAMSYNHKESKTAIFEMYQKATFRKVDEEKLNNVLFEEAKLNFENDPDQLSNFFGMDQQTDAKTASLAIIANAIMNLDEFLTHG